MGGGDFLVSCSDRGPSVALCFSPIGRPTLPFGCGSMFWWSGRPPEAPFRPRKVLIMTRLLGWAHLCWAWDEALGPDSRSDREWGFPIVWIPREGVLPPSSIT